MGDTHSLTLAAMMSLLILPAILLTAQAVPSSLAQGCTTIPCYHPPCPSLCPPPGVCRVAPCFRPPCPEFCDSPPTPPCGCRCAYCGLGHRCVENPGTGAARC